MTPFKKETTRKLNISKLTDIVKQIVYVSLIDPAESKSGLILGLGLPFNVFLTSFVANFLFNKGVKSSVKYTLQVMIKYCV